MPSNMTQSNKPDLPQMWEEIWCKQIINNQEKNGSFGNDDRGKAKTWLIFCEDLDPTSKFLQDKFHVLSERKTIIVQDGTKYQKFENPKYPEKYIVRREYEDDFTKLIKDVEECESISLEGAIYCWSLGKERKQERILKPLFYLTKKILDLNRDSEIKLIALTRGIAPVEDDEIVSSFRAGTFPGYFRSLKIERPMLTCRLIDVGDNETETGMMQINNEILAGGDELIVAYQGTERYIPKLTRVKPTLTDMQLPPDSDKFQLILPKTKIISDLRFGPLELSSLESGEIEVQVKSSSLNFRDVLNILKPSEDFIDANSIGSDFAGVVVSIHPEVSKWRIGDKVFGVIPKNSTFPSHINVHEDDVLCVPDEMTFSEICTLPSAFGTAYHCLMDIAKIKTTDNVLIHTASGGVGICAIQLCKNAGVTIIATAGSKRKQNFLKSLGVRHVFHSRNTDYINQVIEVTNGCGVDVVLNSLTDKGFMEATLKACAPGARFVEMNKLSIWNPEEVKRLRPDVEYSKFDMSEMTMDDRRQLMTKLQELVQRKVVSTLPHARFNGVNVREALEYLQNFKHIGKVVCVTPEVKKENGISEIHMPMFNTVSTYLITGGLGRIGFEVCKWMLKKGAKYILLAARNSPSSAMKDEIDQLNIKHCSKVQYVQIDIIKFNQCRDLISKIPKMGYPILRGIMHAAGIRTVNDGLIENQNWKSFSSTLLAKVEGTLNMHELAKTNPTFEHFVLFSSMTALFGLPGQSNNATGNHFEDTFAQYRYSIGLPATSVNWGQWDEVGETVRADFPGTSPIYNDQGIRGLEYVLKAQRVQTGFINIESANELSKLLPHLPNYMIDGAEDCEN